jgi:rod shape-determining protein MreD
MARLRLALVVVAAVVFQTTLFSSGLRVFGVMPDLCLVLTVAVAFHQGPERGAVFGFAAGFATDLFLSTPLGLSALSFTVVGYGVGLLQSGFVRPSRWVAPFMGALGGLAGGALFVAVGALAGQDHLLAPRSLKVIVVAAAYDALLAFVAFPVARWAIGETSTDERIVAEHPWSGP